jgi:hypothetical protein
MAFAGIPNAKDRGDVIAYLKESKWARQKADIDQLWLSNMSNFVYCISSTIPWLPNFDGDVVVQFNLIQLMTQPI